MKYIIKAKTFSGSMEFTIDAETSAKAEREMAKTLEKRGWEEVKTYPKVSEFKIVRSKLCGI